MSAGHRARDALDGLHPVLDQVGELGEVLHLGQGDHVEGAGDGAGLRDALELADLFGDAPGPANLGQQQNVGLDHGRP